MGTQLLIVLISVYCISNAVAGGGFEGDTTTGKYDNSTTKYATNKYGDPYKNDDYRYGQDMVGDDYGYGYKNYSGIDEYGYSTDPDGEDGIDPRTYGRDYGDKKRIYDYRDSVEGALTVWIDFADDWEADLKTRYRGGKYNRNKYNNDKYGKESRKKRSYKKVTLPVRQYKNIRRFPWQKFPPLFSTFPWLPIFYDKLTYQTFIFSPTGGIYVLPPLVNFFGRRIAVAQLIKWGYASLVSTGIPPPPAVNIAPSVQPAPPSSNPAPGYNANNGRFTNGVQLDPSTPNYVKQVPLTQYGKTNY